MLQLKSCEVWVNYGHVIQTKLHPKHGSKLWDVVT